VIAAHLAFVRDASEPPSAGQDAEQGKLREAHSRRAVIDENDLVARKCQLVAAARGCTVASRKKLEAGVRAGVLDAVARFVGELAEIDFPRVRRETKHVDIGARAENPILAARDDNGTNLGMFETDALKRVVQLDIHAKIVRVQLELVAGAEAAVLRDV